MITDDQIGPILETRLMELEALFPDKVLYPDREGVKVFETDLVIALVIKLVMDRAKYHCCEDHFGDCATKDQQQSQLHVGEALMEFGIKEAVWNR